MEYLQTGPRDPSERAPGGSDSRSGMLTFLSFIQLSPVASRNDGDEILGISLVMDELSCTTGCPNRGLGKRH